MHSSGTGFSFQFNILGWYRKYWNISAKEVNTFDFQNKTGFSAPHLSRKKKKQTYSVCLRIYFPCWMSQLYMLCACFSLFCACSTFYGQQATDEKHDQLEFEAKIGQLHYHMHNVIKHALFVFLAYSSRYNISTTHSELNRRLKNYGPPILLFSIIKTWLNNVNAGSNQFFSSIEKKKKKKRLLS